jgi:hypothetical protein
MADAARPTAASGSAVAVPDYSGTDEGYAGQGSDIGSGVTMASSVPREDT